MSVRSVCVASCVDDARVPVRATYSNLYKWPESDAEFVRSVSSGGRNRERSARAASPGVVDSISCRQMYLRSYSFSRKKETVGEKTKKCWGRVKDRVVGASKTNNNDDTKNEKKKKKENEKDRSSGALVSIFHTLLSCTTKVDVVDGKT